MDIESRIKRLEGLAEKERIKIFQIIFTNELAKIPREEGIGLIAKHFNMTPCDSLWNIQRIGLWHQDLYREAKKMNPKEIYYWVMNMLGKSGS